MILRGIGAAGVALLATGAAAAMAFGVNGSGGLFGGGAGDGELRASSAPSLRLDVTGPLFTATGLTPGAELERCVTVENTGRYSSDLAIFGRRDADALTPHLRLEITRGTRPPAPAGSCAGFTPADAGAVVFSGGLDAFPTAAEAALRPGDELQAGEVRAFRLRVRVTGDGDAIQGLQTVQAFTFGATDSEGGTTRTPANPGEGRRRPPRPNPNNPAAGLEARWCSRVDVPDPDAPGLRRIAGTERWVVARRLLSPFSPQPSARKLGMRIWTNEQGRRLVLALGERWALGVAPARAWDRVTYRLNGEIVGRASARPFVWQIEPEHVYPGENRVRLTIEPRRGKPVSAEFRFRMKAWGEREDESVCTLT